MGDNSGIPASRKLRVDASFPIVVDTDDPALLNQKPKRQGDEGKVKVPTNGEIPDAGQSSSNRAPNASRTQANETPCLAEGDSLTGLPNQSVFNDRVGQAILLARRHQTQLAMLMLSLEGLRGITDLPGHSAGNEMLQSASRLILGCLRTHDTITRLGSDKFLILMQDIRQPDDVATAAGRIQKALASLFSLYRHKHHFAASIGVCLYPNDGLNAATLMKHAENAMNLARSTRRQQCHFYRSDFHALTVSPQSIEQGLPLALKRKEFTLHYQAKFDLMTGNVAGVEALTRWIHPMHGPIAPGQFIPIAERSCRILPIGSWVLRGACIQYRAWAKAGMPAKSIAVNISGTEFQDKYFLKTITAILGETGLGPESLELDVSHSVLMRHPGQSAFILKALRDLGIHVSVDNFGVGDFNPASLEEFALCAIKIDRQVVHRITTFPDGAAAVGAIIRLGRRLNLRVIAEGVETAGDLEFLWANDCDEAQGNFLSRSMPPEQLVGLLGLRRSSTGNDLMSRLPEQLGPVSYLPILLPH